MKSTPGLIYQTAAQIDARIAALQSQAMMLSADNKRHRELLREITKLRAYADAKRWVAAPSFRIFGRQ